MNNLPERKMTVGGALEFAKAVKAHGKSMLDEFFQIITDPMIDTAVRIARVMDLIKGHEDLILGFSRFIPVGHHMQTPALVAIERNLATEHEYGRKNPTGVVEMMTHPDMQQARKRRPDDEERKQELGYFARVKGRLDAVSFQDFEKCLEIYGKEIISRKELTDMVNQILGEYPDLMVDFNIFLDDWEVRDDGLSDEQVKRPRIERRKTIPKKVVAKTREKIDKGRSHKPQAMLVSNHTDQKFVGEKQTTGASLKPLGNPLVSPSYKLVTKSQFSSHVTNLGKSVLNNEVELKRVTCKASGDYVEGMRGNQHEEVLHKCEDDRYQLDLLVERVKSIVKRLSKLLKKMRHGTIQPGNPFRIEGHISPLYLRCIEQLYGDCGMDVIEVIRKDPHRTLPIILHRLDQKKEEFSKCRLDFEKVWKNVYFENYQKSKAFQAQNLMTRRNTLINTPMMEMKINNLSRRDG